MKKHAYSFAFVIAGLFSVGGIPLAWAISVPPAFQSHDPDSSLTIDFRDLDSLLRTVVLDTGPSTREMAKPSNRNTGTRVKTSVNRATINEANRFYYEIFDDNPDNQQIIWDIRSRLENLPELTPLEQYSRNEQLAYWINLYNITILGEIVKVYPRHNLKGMLVGKTPILSEKILTVAGEELSLDDIQFTILRQNYDNNPLIIYGLYQGNIGGPNIRKSAYSGRHIYGELADNAVEFINSNRGTRGKNKKVFRVSMLYERNEAFFEGSDAVLREHLLRYIEGEERGELQAASTIKADISDWTITDLYGSYRDMVGSLANNNAALLGAVPGSQSNYLTDKAAQGRFSPTVTQQLNELDEKREPDEQESIGVVTVEELDDINGEENN